MKRKLFIIISAVLAIVLLTSSALAEASHEKRLRTATNLVNEMAEQGDAADMATVIKSAKGIAIFPSVTKAGFIFGGQIGEGLVLIRNQDGSWNGPSFMTITGASWGFQIGAQSVGLILVITNEEGLHAFTGGNSIKLGGDIAVAAGPVGRDTSAATDGRGKASIYSYSISKGLYAGVSLEGSVINQNRDANKAFWGRPFSAQDALRHRTANKQVRQLRKAIKRLERKAK